MTAPSPLAGGCTCGAIRYLIAAAPITVLACHCTSCRKQSGATFSVNLVVRASTMTVEGQLACWEDSDTASGVPIQRQFCGKCGSPIRSVLPASPEIILVKAGTLDAPGDFAPAMHFWTRSALPWVTIPEGAPRHEQQTMA